MAETKTTRTLAIALSIAVSCLAGCAGIHHVQQEVSIRDLARRAYRLESACPQSPKYARHFERGWKQAYYNISKGADPCPPSTPPEPYWSTKYQNAEGGRKIAAWFEGYRCGALAAQRDCRQWYSTVPIGAHCVRESATQCAPVPPLRDSDPSHASADSEIMSPHTNDTGIQLSSFESTAVRLPAIDDE